jgi:hypothetical protein
MAHLIESLDLPRIAGRIRLPTPRMKRRNQIECSGVGCQRRLWPPERPVWSNKKLYKNEIGFYEVLYEVQSLMVSQKKSTMPVNCHSCEGRNPVVSSHYGFLPSQEWLDFWLLTVPSSFEFHTRCQKMSNHGCPKYSQISIPRVNRPPRKPVAELTSATWWYQSQSLNSEISNRWSVWHPADSSYETPQVDVSISIKSAASMTGPGLNSEPQNRRTTNRSLRRDQPSRISKNGIPPLCPLDQEKLIELLPSTFRIRYSLHPGWWVSPLPAVWFKLPSLVGWVERFFIRWVSLLLWALNSLGDIKKW